MSPEAAWAFMHRTEGERRKYCTDCYISYLQTHLSEADELFLRQAQCIESVKAIIKSIIKGYGRRKSTIDAAKAMLETIESITAMSLESPQMFLVSNIMGLLVARHESGYQEQCKFVQKFSWELVEDTGIWISPFHEYSMPNATLAIEAELRLHVDLVLGRKPYASPK